MAEFIGGISLEDIMAAAMENLDQNPEVECDPEVESDLKKTTDQKNDTSKIVETNPYDYDLDTFVNKVFALNLVEKSYRDLKDDVNDRFCFDEAFKSMVKELFPGVITYECDSPIKCYTDIDVELLELLTYGMYKNCHGENKNSYSEIFKNYGLMTTKNVLEYPIVFDDKQSFSLCVTTDIVSRTKAELFVQYIIYSLAANAKKGDVCFRCADKEKSGQSFGKFISLIGSNLLFGKGMYSDESGISGLVDELNQIAEKNFSQLKGRYKSVYDYNENNDKKIPVTLAVFCDLSGFSYSKSDEKLKKVMKNSHNSAISTVFLMNANCSTSYNNMKKQIHIVFEDNCAYLVQSGCRLSLDISKAVFTDSEYNLLEDKLNAIEKIDTDFQSHYDLNNFELFTRDATDGLSIPFAFDDNNEFVDLEIGDSTPHALLSGSTGSGKSVTLHAIINMTMMNYHPDDVEIWAIDYKAVEFACYVNKRTPHITVIGQDNSEDFTLGLIDLIKSEYDRRKDLFVKNNCKDFKAYRKAFGSRSISRILIVIDEFHNMTQAISGYMGEKDYRKILENLLSEMRAMGMSFLFCSQTIAAGLNGLTEKGRSQIGCRLSMKHEDIMEIKETLSLSISSGVDFESIKYLRQGELIYKKISNKPGMPPYSLERVNVLYTEPYRDIIIDKINSNMEDGYIKRKETICKNSKRYHVTEKPEHPLSAFIKTGEKVSNELLTVYPGAPTSLKDFFSFELDEETGNNVLLVGENDSMRESIIISSVLSMLIDPQNTIVASILDTEDSDNQRLYSHLKKITSDRLELNYGYDEVMCCIDSLKKIKPYANGRKIYLWYGLNKLKNFIFLHSQEEESNDEAPEGRMEDFDKIPEGVDPLDFLNRALEMVDSGEMKESDSAKKYNDKLDFKDCQDIIRKLEEYGSENNRYCFMIYNTYKGLKKAKISQVENYEYRIGLKMSTDDSYDLFGSSSFASKADDSTAVFYSGSKIATTIRPYLLPDGDFFHKFNQNMEGLL